jgi:hypothetical protein
MNNMEELYARLTDLKKAVLCRRQQTNQISMYESASSVLAAADKLVAFLEKEVKE